MRETVNNIKRKRGRPKKSDHVGHCDDLRDDKQDFNIRLGLIIDLLEAQMANIQDLNDKIAELSNVVSSEGIKIDSLATEMTSAFSRLEAKIAAGIDTQPQIDALQPILQAVVDKSAAIDSAIAQAQVTGI